MKIPFQIQSRPTTNLYQGAGLATRTEPETGTALFSLGSVAVGTPVNGSIAETTDGPIARFSLASCNVNLSISRTVVEDTPATSAFSLGSVLVRQPVNNSVVEPIPATSNFSLLSSLVRQPVNRTVSEDTPQTANFSLLSCNAGLSPINTAWLARVVAAGGVAPAQTTYQGNDIFYNALVAAGIDSKIKIALLLAPDSLIAAATPLIKNTGNNSWGIIGFAGGDLTVNGLLGASGKRLDTGANTSNIFGSDTSAGVSIYTFTMNGNTEFELGRFGSAAGQCFQASLNWSDTKVRFDAFDNNVSETQVASPAVAGFYGMNRTANNVAKVFFANSGNAPAQVTPTNTIVCTSTRFTDNLVAFVTMTQSGVPLFPTTKRLSAIILHDGLTLTEWTDLYNAIQAARTKFGGGFV